MYVVLQGATFAEFSNDITEIVCIENVKKLYNIVVFQCFECCLLVLEQTAAGFVTEVGQIDCLYRYGSMICKTDSFINNASRPFSNGLLRMEAIIAYLGCHLL